MNKFNYIINTLSLSKVHGTAHLDNGFYIKTEAYQKYQDEFNDVLGIPRVDLKQSIYLDGVKSHELKYLGRNLEEMYITLKDYNPDLCDAVFGDTPLTARELELLRGYGV